MRDESAETKGETMKKENRGGQRAGAGRKPIGKSKKIPMTIKIAPDLREYLKTLGNATAAIELGLRESKDFNKWKENQKNVF